MRRLLPLVLLLAATAKADLGRPMLRQGLGTAFRSPGAAAVEPPPIYVLGGPWVEWFEIGGTGTHAFANGHASLSGTSTTTYIADGTDHYVKSQTLASSGWDTYLGNLSLDPWWTAFSSPRLDVDIQYSAAQANVRAAVGMLATTAGETCDSDDMTARRGTWFQSSTTAANTNWWCCANKDAATTSCVDSGVVASGTWEVMSIRYSAPGAAKGYIDDEEVCTFPAAYTPDDVSHTFAPLVCVRTLENVAKAIQMRGMIAWGR